uniref:Pheromone phb3.1 n=1 Tax=Coprinopsis cinerea TaxID=5346 RepID=Q875K5_COPCI|nr:pheromone phb3.1 [Coprinopsis cinerea]
MTDSFTSLDQLLFAEEAFGDAPVADSRLPTSNAMASAADTIAPSSSISLDGINDLPADFERRTFGSSGPTWWCVNA